MHKCGPHCQTVEYLTRLTKKRLRLDAPRVFPVKTWCRICGVPALLEVLNDYDQAVRHFYALDDTPMVHKGIHTETGGWGVHWRLDEVLACVFPREHVDTLWPMPIWWEQSHGAPQSENQGILVMGDGDLNQYRHTYMDDELRMLEAHVNRNPKDRDELEKVYSDIWNTSEVARHYEILGFKSPFAIARCKTTGERGSLVFQNVPRYYFGWDAERVI